MPSSLFLSQVFQFQGLGKITQALGLPLLLLASGACLSPTLYRSSPAPVAPQSLAYIAGPWQDEEDPQYLVGIEESSWILASAGQVLSVSRFLTRQGSRIEVCQGGWRKAWEVRHESADSLSITDPQSPKARRLRRLPFKPPALQLTPLQLAEPRPLPAGRVAEIQRQLWERAGRAQTGQGQAPPEGKTLLPSAEPRGERGAFSVSELGQIDQWTQTVAYLKALVMEVGWIDVERFGYATANAAFFIAHHSSDLPLMMAALPGVEKDALSGRTEGEDYALLFDRVQLALGKKQRYGTQVGFDSANRAFVLSIEDPGGVGQRRESLGMMPLRDYVRAVARFNQASAPPEVLFSENCADL